MISQTFKTFLGLKIQARNTHGRSGHVKRYLNKSKADVISFAQELLRFAWLFVVVWLKIEVNLIKVLVIDWNILDIDEKTIHRKSITKKKMKT